MKSSSTKLVKAIAAALAIAGAGISADSFAVQSTGSFAVTATVVAACTVTGTTLAFGNVDWRSNKDSTSTLTATCTNGSGYTIGLDAGAGGGTVATRMMSNGAARLNYSLSTVAPGGTNWDDIGGTTVAIGTGDGLGQAITVHGRVPLGQTMAVVGAYSDTILATIDF